jgi:hypothetical protein
MFRFKLERMDQYSILECKFMYNTLPSTVLSHCMRDSF